MPKVKPAIAPTRETYAELLAAYDHFNKALFGGALPPCLITLQRKDKRVMGYFSPTRFGHRAEKRTTDEIALNPMHFRTRDDIEVLQTLVHEMCHLWQAHFGQPSRKSYHNQEWAAKMQEIGLMPSSTGQPGGKTTGQHMGDYVIAGGPFAKAAKALKAQGFKLAWYDRAVELADAATGAAGGKDGNEEGGEDGEAAPSASGKRVKFTCGGCGVNAWGKASLNLICGDCDVPLAAEG
jgi:hypothetical protein